VVSPAAPHLRPGSRSDPPSPCILLEYAGTVVDHEALWILWRYERERRQFRDLAQVRARGADWAVALRPIAIRELAPEPEGIAMFDYEGARDRLLNLMGAELVGSPARGRGCARYFTTACSRGSRQNAPPRACPNPDA
jgi:hypothetical protein